MDETKKIFNDLFVEVFNLILSLEERTLSKEAALDVTMTEIHVLEAIEKSELPIMGNVAKKLMVTMGTLTTSVNRLVSKGYLTRRKDAEDRRKVFLDLTDPAREILSLHAKFHEDLIDSALDGISDGRELLAVLTRIRDHFKKLQQDG